MASLLDFTSEAGCPDGNHDGPDQTKLSVFADAEKDERAKSSALKLISGQAVVNMPVRERAIF